jgi:phage recombination protein Bet
MANNEVLVITADKISKVTGYSPEEIAIVKGSVAKNTSDRELAYFLSVAKQSGLNPFMKEIWCYKDNRSNLLVFAGRDGFLAKAQTNPSYSGIRSSEVRTNDEFGIDIANNKIKHTFGKDDRGTIIGAYAIAFRKDGEPTIEWADIKDYDKKQFTWESHKAAMIKKVAETNALKKAFGITGIQSEYDYEIKNNIATPLQISDDDELTVLQKRIIEKLSTYTGSDKNDIKLSCDVARNTGTFTIEFAKERLEELERGQDDNS